MALTIVAQFQARPGRKAELESLLLALIPPTRAEAGCEVYELHRSVENEGFYHFHEIWTTREHWDAHMRSAHLKAFQTANADLVDDVKLFQMELLL